MQDAFVVTAHNKRGQRDDVFLIVVPDVLQTTKLALASLFGVNEIGYLNIFHLIKFLAHEVNLTGTQVTYKHLIAQMQQVLINSILDDLLNVSLTVTPSYEIAQAYVAEIDLAVGLQQVLSVDVVALHSIDELRLSVIAGVVEDNVCRDVHLLGLHILADARGRCLLANGVGQKNDEVVEEWNVADAVTFNDILQHHRIKHATQVFPHLFVIIEAYHVQAWQTTIVKIGSQAVVAVVQSVELKEFCIAKTLDGDLNVASAQ